MKRLSLYLVVTCVVFDVGVGASFAQRRYTPKTTARTSSGNSAAGQCFVLVEKTGLDVYAGLYAAVDDVKNRLALLKAENAKRNHANHAIDNAIKDLRAEISARKREIAKAEKEADEPTKAGLVKEIAALEEQIVEKATERVILVKFVGPKQFRTRKAAEKYIEAQYEAADDAKEAEDDKRRAAERRRQKELAERKKRDAEDPKP